MENQLTFKFKNFGYLEKGDIKLSNLTIICGKNNVGKTYINYGIYGFMKSALSNIRFIEKEKEIENLKKDGFLKINLKQYESKIQKNISKVSKEYTTILHNFFATEEDFFKNTKFDVLINNLNFKYVDKKEVKGTNKDAEFVKIIKPEKSSEIEITISKINLKKAPFFIVIDIINRFIGRCLLEEIFPNTQVITSERTGVSLFYKELDFTKNRMLEYISKSGKKKKRFNPFDFLEEFSAQYPQTIQNNIDTIRSLAEIKKKKSKLLQDINHSDEIIKKLRRIMQGDFKIINDEIYYCQGRGKNKIIMPIHMASSSVKALVLFDTYIKHIAKKGDLLIIDEPELNLHPDLQVLMAQLIVKLTNYGINILITTHSDYILKEINNSLMLSQKFKGKKIFMKKNKYTSLDELNKNKILVYVNGNKNVSEVEIDKFGIKYEKLDNFICELNNKSSLLVDLIEVEK